MLTRRTRLRNGGRRSPAGKRERRARSRSEGQYRGGFDNIRSQPRGSGSALLEPASSWGRQSRAAFCIARMHAGGGECGRRLLGTGVRHRVCPATEQPGYGARRRSRRPFRPVPPTRCSRTRRTSGRTLPGWRPTWPVHGPAARGVPGEAIHLIRSSTATCASASRRTGTERASFKYWRNLSPLACGVVSHAPLAPLPAAGRDGVESRAGRLVGGFPTGRLCRRRTDTPRDIAMDGTASTGVDSARAAARSSSALA
jgi:hypothetical protein